MEHDKFLYVFLPCRMIFFNARQNGEVTRKLCSIAGAVPVSKCLYLRHAPWMIVNNHTIIVTVLRVQEFAVVVCPVAEAKFVTYWLLPYLYCVEVLGPLTGP